MMPCVLLLSLDKKEASEDFGLTEDELKFYGNLAILMGVIAPLTWTFKTYFTRSVIEDKSYVINDLAIDTVLA